MEIIKKINTMTKNFLQKEVLKAIDKCNQKEMEYLEAEKEFQEVYAAYKHSLLYVEE